MTGFCSEKVGKGRVKIGKFEENFAIFVSFWSILERFWDTFEQISGNSVLKLTCKRDPLEILTQPPPLNAPLGKTEKARKFNLPRTSKTYFQWLRNEPQAHVANPSTEGIRGWLFD